MDIISVRVIRPKDRTSPVLAFADINTSSGVQLRDMKLLRGREEGSAPTLKMPSMKSKSGVYRDVFNPISSEARQTMTDAVVEALRQAEEADVNDFTAKFDVPAAAPEFTNIRIHKFPENRQLKAFVSCILDGAVALNHIAVVLDEETKELRVSMPNHTIARTGAYAGYFRMQKDEYLMLYDAVMEAYSAPEEPAS